MNSLKPVLLLLVLGGVGFGVYRALHKRDRIEPPPGVDAQWASPLDVQLPNPASIPSTASGSGPTVLSPQSLGSAPLFDGKASGTAVPAAAVGATTGAGPAAGGISTTPGFADGSAKRPGGEGPNETGTTGSPFPGLGTAGDKGFAASVGQGPPTGDRNGAASGPAGVAAEGAGSSSFEVAMRQIEPLLGGGKLVQALKELSVWHDHPQLTPADEAKLQGLLDQLAGTVIYSREHVLYPAYRVQEGERLQEIAQKYSVPWELLAKINGVDDPARLVAGEELKVVRGPFSAVVNLPKRRMTLWLDGFYAGSFPVQGMGQPGANLEGDYQVNSKTVGPMYNGPNGVIPAGDPSNPLGKLLLALSNEVAIHGGPEGAAEDPRGSIRVSARDIEDVFDILSEGSRVTIRR